MVTGIRGETNGLALLYGQIPFRKKSTMMGRRGLLETPSTSASGGGHKSVPIVRTLRSVLGRAKGWYHRCSNGAIVTKGNGNEQELFPDDAHTQAKWLT